MNQMYEKDCAQLLHDRGICLIIPVYNNGGTIASVIAQCRLYCRDIIVVNDGSTDETGEILEHIEDITIVQYPKNRGKGYALKRGFNQARALGFAYAITMDADGQHYAKDIPLFLEANLKDPGAFIIGSRNMKGKERSSGSVFANRFSNFWFFVETLRYLPDTQTGFRLYPLHKIKGTSFITSRYEAELELLVFSAWHGVKLIPISVDVYYPSREERVSHFRPISDFVRISILNVFLCILSVIYALPLFLLRNLFAFFCNLYAGFFFVLFSLFFITPFVLLYTNIGAMNEHKKTNLHKIIYRIARFVMIVHGIPGTSFRYANNNPNLGNKASVIVCNHQSHLDLMCQLIFTPKIVFLTNDWVWHNPFYGSIIRNADYLPVSRGIDQLLPSLRELVNKGYSIAVFPEGTRSKDLTLGRFHQGAFYIAEQLNLDIIPMYLYGTGKVLPKKKHVLRRGHMFIEVAESMTRSELTAMGDIKSQASAVRKIYESKLFDLSNRMARFE